MPYPNEHSARLINPPKDFIRVRRTNGSGDGTVQGAKVPTSISVIWYIVKKDKKEVPIAQALRFPIKKWTTEKARKWLKDHKIKYIRFEPASGKEKQSAIVENEGTVSAKACIFNDCAEVMFAAADVDKDEPQFKIVGYSGGIIRNHFYWGDVAFDLKGLKFAKNRTPVLEEHFNSRRLGFATKQEIKDKVMVEGRFLKNEIARQMADDLRAGFPMEASLYVPPSVVEQVEKGASVEVNGHTLKGPGAVFRKAVIREVSMCVFGADSNTASTAYADNDNNVRFNLIKETNIMETEQLTIESADQFAEQYPDIHREIFDSGRQQGITEAKEEQKQLFAKLQEICGDDSGLLIECFSGGKSIEDTQRLRMQKLQQANKKLSEDLQNAQRQKVDPAITEFSDDQAKLKAQAPIDEATATDDQLKEHFAKTQELQDEFGDVDSYLAYIKHDVRGKK